ncbi:MAG: DNA-protecting protein DprA [Acidobacteria bacterium]|nr:DNA-protecting protein DprA [Acidobacteriota bacterium]
MSGQLPPPAWLAALASLPGMGPARLRTVLSDRDPEAAWDQARFGALGVAEDLSRRWVMAARQIDVEALWARHQSAGIRVLSPGLAGWPRNLHDDPEPPALLFARGDPAVLDRPCVAVVGTRRCTAAGRSLAHELGSDLAAAGICVVSGLALGIDAAAHRGALSAAGGAAPAAVVGTGLDVVYPARNRELWDLVADRGGLLSEYPLGTGPERWRFPARNRIIAGLADVVVVVESDVTGGSMHTVEAALERDRTVLAVPGPVRSRASAGTNALLAAGSLLARDATDVLVALGLDVASRSRVGTVTGPGGSGDQVLDALGWEPATLEQLAERLGTPLGPVAVVLVELERDGWVAQRSGWYERLR